MASIYHAAATLSQADTKHRLINAAGRLFADLGYTAVSIREIAAEAGVHFSLVNYHFGSKRELYRAALDAAVSCPDHAEKQAMLEQVTDPEEMLFEVAHYILLSHSNHRIERWQIKLLLNELQSEEPDWEVLYKHWLPGTEMLQSAFAQIRGVSAPEHCDRINAISFFIMVDNMGSHSKHFKSTNELWGGPDFDPETLARHYVGLFMNGIHACNSDS